MKITESSTRVARATKKTKETKETNNEFINVLDGLQKKIDNANTQYEIEDIINEYNYKLALNFKNITHNIITEYDESMIEAKETKFKREKELESKRSQLIDEKDMYHRKEEFEKEEGINSKLRKNNIDIKTILDKYDITRAKLINEKDKKLRELEIQQTEYRKEFNFIKSKKIYELRANKLQEESLNN